MFNTVLIANRGEIACRAIRTLKRLGVTSVAVYSDADRNARHVTEADVAVALGGDKASDSYLRIDKILAAAQQSGAQAIWPGYGFLSESLPFAAACEEAGIAFVGPTAQQIGEFGLKHRARELAAERGRADDAGHATAQLAAGRSACSRGGRHWLSGDAEKHRGRRRHRSDALRRRARPLEDAWESVRRLGEQFFSDAGVFLERCIDRARHVEVQIFGDGKGKVMALGERDCSLQRRNQKVVEETPAPNLPARPRVKRCWPRRCSWASWSITAAPAPWSSSTTAAAGRVLFPGGQHPPAGGASGHRVRHRAGPGRVHAARGGGRSHRLGDRLQQAPQGASIEVRLYAEDPLKNFQPQPGRVNRSQLSRLGCAWTAGSTTGSEVSAFYDPMIAKLIVQGDTRDAALAKLQQALDATRLHGIATNLDYLRQIVATDAFRSGNVWTRFLDGFTPAASVIEVLQPGTFSSVQDFPGRLGYWDIGVPPSGPMDDFAFRLANRIVGNHASAAGLEFTLQGPTLRFHSDAVIALTGADCPADARWRRGAITGSR